MIRNSIRPFQISVPEDKLSLLGKKLELTAFPEQVSFSDDEKYGASRARIEKIVEHWKSGYSWREHEARLNTLPQFTTTVEVDGFGDLDIHFIHKRSKSADSIPLLFCHGCKSWYSISLCFANNFQGPGSFLEVTKILPLLTNPHDGPSFHVVAPSLPNFGFSDKVTAEGFSICHYAQAMHQVMLNLGYNKYGKYYVACLRGVCPLMRLFSHPRRRLGVLHHPFYRGTVPRELCCVACQHADGSAVTIGRKSLSNLLPLGSFYQVRE